MTATIEVRAVDPYSARAKIDLRDHPEAPDLFEVETSFGYVTVWRERYDGQCYLSVCGPRNGLYAGRLPATWPASDIADAWEPALRRRIGYDRAQLIEAVELLQTATAI